MFSYNTSIIFDTNKTFVLMHKDFIYLSYSFTICIHPTLSFVIEPFKNTKISSLLYPAEELNDIIISEEYKNLLFSYLYRKIDFSLVFGFSFFSYTLFLRTKEFYF